MNTATTLSLINAQPSDIDRKLAERAYSNTSQFPARRADGVQNDYVAHMQQLEAEFLPFATTPELCAALQQALDDYRREYIRHIIAYLRAHSQVASAMVVGPANFPTARNDKRIATADRRLQELTDWKAKARKQLQQQFNPQAPRTITADLPDAVDSLTAKLAERERQQERMIAANKIIRAGSEKADIVARLVNELGYAEGDAYTLLVPNYMGRVGYEDFTLRNNGAEIRRLRTRIDEVQAQQARPERRADFDGGYVLDNPDNNRVQIFYDAKPSADVIATLKRNAFKWARSEGAWQRQRTAAGIYAAEQVTGAKFAAA